MADEFDVEALLEAPYNKEINGERDGGYNHNGVSSSKDRKHHRSNGKSDRRRSSRSRSPRHKSSDHHHHRSKSEHKSRHRSRSRDKSKSKHHGSDSRRRHSTKSRERSKSKDAAAAAAVITKKDESRSSSRDRKKRRRSLTPIALPGRSSSSQYGSGRPPFRKYSPTHGGGGYRPLSDDLTPEERDARTIFCMQLSQRIRAKDLEDFFSSVGKVRDVRLITCNKTRRFKGIAYIEFKDPESVTLALGLNGQKLLDIPIIVQPTQAEKNRVGNPLPNMAPRGHSGPVKLYVGSLHFNITENMLRGIFEPFGKIDSIQLLTDPETGRSKGYGFITYHNADDAKKAVEQMNGFELAGRSMKVNNVSDRHEFSSSGGGGGSSLDTDELDRAGIDLGATGRLQLMYKLAEGTGMEIPPAAASALNLNQIAQGGAPLIPQAAPPIATQCFMLANMFDPTAESVPNWEMEIRDDVVEECNKHGGCVHVFVDKASPQGNVYVKCPSIVTAVAAVNSLHGRWFGGRIITAAYVPIINYHNLFPDVIAANEFLTPYRIS